MVWKRDPFKGEFTEEKTRKSGSDEGRAKTSGRKRARVEEPDTRILDRDGDTRRPGQAPRAARLRFEAPTQKIDASQRPGGRGSGDERTRLHLGRSGASVVKSDTAGDTAGAGGDPMEDPVVGWLVVVAGPGRGRVCRLGYGVNTLGRGEGSRVRLDFGDERVSRESHATLTYDPRGRKFYVQHGGGMNLTYLGDEPVLVPTPIEAMQDVGIGGTTLRFVPFCGPEFDWQDRQDQDPSSSTPEP